MVTRIVLILSAGLFIWNSTAAQDVEYENRLPRSFLPYHYNLYLEPYLESQEPPFPLIGEVKIYFTCHQNSKILTLTSVGLTFGNENVTISHLKPPSIVDTLKVQNIRFDNSTEFVDFEIEGKFEKNSNYTIEIKYHGNIMADNEGMYAASYLDKDGKIKYLAATQLETIGARRMFPGFDELDMKATFEVAVSRSPNHTTLFNTPVIRTYELFDGRMTDVFETTPVMTPYLLAIVVGELRYLESKVDPDVKYKVGVYTSEQMQPYAYHANKFFTVPLLRWMEKETSVPYSLNKIDHIALSNFGGAMENWGLITYSEDVLLTDSKTSTATGLFRAAYVMAHELSHMWYGNLVTCEWWTHAWLQEALASYYNFYPLEALGWQASELQQLEGVSYYMNIDQTNRSTPVRIAVKSPQNAIHVFERSVYDKGGAMIRMLEQIMTRPVLKLALTRYLNQYKYSVANSDQFLQVLTDQARDSNITYPDGSEINFKKLMDPWLDQKGFPILKVVDNNDGTATVSQQRYFNPSNQIEHVASSYGYKWDVPLLVLDDKSQPSDWFKAPNYWLKASDKDIKIKIPKDGWYIINPNQKFYYKVFYDRKQRSIMSKNIKKLPVESRANIIADTFGLARNAYYGATDAFDNILSLGTDQSYNAWSLTLNHVYDLEPFFMNETWYPKYNVFFSKQADSLLEKIGYEFKTDETISETFLRRDAISAACWFGSETCLKYIRKKYQEYKANPALNSVNANILPTILCDGVAHGKKEDWDLMGKEYLKRKVSPVPEERQTLLFARSCTPREEELQEIIDELLDDVNGTFFNPSDFNVAAQYLAGTPYGASVLWKYLKTNWIFSPLRLDKRIIIYTITEPWFTDSQLKELKDFKEHLLGLTNIDKSFFSYITIRTEQNIQFYKDNNVDLGKWFDDKYGQNTTTESEIKEPIRMSDFKIRSSIGLYNGNLFNSMKRRFEMLMLVTGTDEMF